MGYQINTPWGTVNQGSWGILPEFGLTEAAAQKVSGGQTTDLSNAVTGNYAPPPQMPPDYTKIYSTVGQNNPQQIFSNPIPTQPQPQQTQQSSGGGFDMSLYPGWGEAEARADFAATGGPRRSSGTSSTPNYSAEIDSIYNPLYNSLNDQANFVTNTQLPQSLAGLVSSTQQLQDDLEAKKAESALSVQRQQGTLSTQKLSANDEANRAYKAMLQNAQARFGGRNSAGLAASEIAGKEYLRQQGRTDQTYAENFQKLTDYGNSVDMFTLQESRRIARESETAKLEIQTQAQQRLVAIGYDKNSLDSAKASAKLDVVREATNRINALTDARTTSLLELNQWKSQQDYILQTNLKQIAAIPQQTYSQPFQNNPTVETGNNPTTYQPQYVASSTKPNDQFSGLINPFA